MAADRDADEPTRTSLILSRGTVVSHYEIIEKIAAGGMGEVYLAHDTRLDRRVALKFLPIQLAAHPDAKTRFTREAQAAAALDHPNVITIHEVGEVDGRPYFAMQHVEGRTLREVIRDDDPSIDEVLDLAIQIAEGLEEAHGAGIIHRDIKPSNILVTERGRPILADFGLAAVAGGVKVTQTGSTLGTIAYMSPGQVRGRAPDRRSDLFSYGVVLYEMLTGRQPFERENEAATLHAIVNEIPEPLARYRAEVPEELQRIVDKVMAKDPAERYQHADELVVDLRRIRRELDPLSTTTMSRAAMTARPRRGRTGWLLAGALMVVAAIVSVALFRLGAFRPARERTDVATSMPVWSRSIAVLPFRDFSAAGDQEFFCDGMTDAIIGRLSRLESVKVISMTSVMSYKGADRNLKRIGEELSVDHILEGSIQREADGIRVRAQLIAVADDAHLWSETYDRGLEGVFSIQDDISRAIVEAMRVEFLGDEAGTFAGRRTESVEAYDLYTRGRHRWSKRTAADLERAIEYFQQAIALDPGYAMAHVGLADAWSVLPGYGTQTEEEVLPHARQAVMTALEIDEQLAEAHASLGLILKNEERHEEAERRFLRAIELNPGYASAHQWYGLVLDDLGRFEESVRQMAIALELDPLSIPVLLNVANNRESLGDWRGAEQLHRRRIEIAPDRGSSHAWLAFHLMRRGDVEGARREIETALEVSPRDPVVLVHYGGFLRLSGQYEQAIEHFEQLNAAGFPNPWCHIHPGMCHLALGRIAEARAELGHESVISSDGGEIWLLFVDARAGNVEPARAYLQEVEQGTHEIDSHFSIAGLYMVIGDVDLAFAHLDRSYDKHEFLLSVLPMVDAFDDVREDPRYVAILEKIGLAEFW